ncbi:MAG: hypothetical protein CVU89_03270 [Firmicutes bacterium HGW-Firmicutes-14]|nr:MAG: hypothetical protein CVU89_03270 [Firmicutes bacterium HGW-Firmicutes-14]
MKLIYAVLIAVNIFGFVLMGYDKLQAKRGGRRVPEISFFIISLVGGSAGVFIE